MSRKPFVERSGFIGDLVNLLTFHPIYRKEVKPPMSRDAQMLHDALRAAAVRQGLGRQFDEVVRGLTFRDGDFNPNVQTHTLTITVESGMSRDETVRQVRSALPYESGVVTVTAVS